MERALAPYIQTDPACKMVFLSGPRQAGESLAERRRRVGRGLTFAASLSRLKTIV